jgi:ribosomal protein S18 acetylase RimI-like enzyme
VDVRPFRAADREACLALAGRLTEGVAAWRDPDAVLSAVRGWVAAAVEAVDEPSQAMFLAERSGRVVGLVAVAERVHFSGEVDAYVGELAVAADAEGQGVGRALMEAAEAWARSRGRAHITLETGAANTRAREFYQRLGYLTEDVRLTKALPPSPRTPS